MFRAELIVGVRQQRLEQLSAERRKREHYRHRKRYPWQAAAQGDNHEHKTPSRIERRVEQIKQYVRGHFHERTVQACEVIQRHRILDVRDRHQLSQHPCEGEANNAQGRNEQRRSSARSIDDAGGGNRRHLIQG